ncbi:MAG: HNH endonuclease [Bacteroidales bacterium]|nr:HNH endonuclease [Bacteroidales bacterium]
MRPVEKGDAPKIYNKYGDARHDLAGIIGYYCSYCEMKVKNSIEVEHILPRNQGGEPVDWDNFLLSCKYCNTIKSDHNNNLSDYLWPDRDNTDLAFEYSEATQIIPNSHIHLSLQRLAQNSIDLMGLDRVKGGINEPTEADTRWISRKEAWDLARRSYINWKEASILPMAREVAIASLNGHYSIWIEVFKNDEMVITEIDREYSKIGLYKQFNINTREKTVRTNGQI